MATDIATLQKMYIDSCGKHGVLPNTSVLSCFLKAEIKKSCNELCSLDIFFEQLKDIDFPPLLDLCMSIETSEIEAVDVYNGFSCVSDGEYALSLMRSFVQKLRLVDLRDSLYGKELFRDLSQGGLACQVLYLSSLCLQKLSMAGEFTQIRILNLDFNTSLTSFREDCFTCMPNLISLSMCATRVANLWTTHAAISKLPSLVELRFQKWVCCNETGSSSAPYHRKLVDLPEFLPSGNISEHLLAAEEKLGNVLFNDVATNQEQEVQWMIEDPSDDTEMDFLSQWQENDRTDSLSSASLWWNSQNGMQDEVPFCPTLNHIEESFPISLSRHSANVALKYISHHASPICLEKHYREFMIASLPHLKTLDNLAIIKNDKEKAVVTFAEHFECLPYKRKRKESVVSLLHSREIKESRSCLQANNHKPSYPSRNSQHFYSRSFSAAKVGSSAWPYLHSLSLSCPDSGGRSYFRPRQFEYHPSISSLLVFGTLDGEVVVVNHENEKIVSYVPSIGAMNSVLGLCWLKKYPSKLIAGSDNGSLKLYDVEHMPPKNAGVYSSGAGSVTFDDFDQLTSVHVNATDELFLASGYSKNIALYDINCGRRIQMFTDMHCEHINVVKFSNHSPSLFATSSFDRDVKLWDLRQKPLNPCYTSQSSRGNVMVCFSPDDHHLLVSAVDNEVRQLLAVDGRPHLNFEISPTGSSQNYTRSYYMNGRDYIVSGSCDEHVVRICCAQTGRRLKDISLEETSMYVQSLRGDPFRDFNMSILAASMRPNSKYEIVKVNLLASADRAKECSYRRHCEPSNSMGG